MTETKNYNLNQWDAADPVRREDFNSDNAKLDAALGEQAQALSAVAAATARCGNCRIVCGSYKGTGAYGSDNPCTLNLGRKPLFVVVLPGRATGYGTMLCAANGSPQFDPCIQYPNSRCVVTWTSSGISWYGHQNPEYQLNAGGVTYYYVALLAADE